MNRHLLRMIAGFTALSTIAALGCNGMVGGKTTTPQNALSAQQQKDGWRLLFDGSTTNGWRGYKAPSPGPGWKVIDGLLTRAADSAGDIVTRDKYRNFDFVLDWRIAEGGNSGIMYRATEDNNYIWYSAPEMQILDDARHNDGKSPLTSAGAVFALYPAPRGVVHPAGEWNSARILVNGNHVEHWLNGTKMLEFNFGSDDWNTRVAASKFKTLPNFGKAAEGHIGLQDHGDRVEFRNIRIKVLP